VNRGGLSLGLYILEGGDGFLPRLGMAGFAAYGLASAFDSSSGLSMRSTLAASRSLAT
jgi:hypothetical protein